MELPNYDNWRMGGNPRDEFRLYDCPDCGESTITCLHTEYGTGELAPDACHHCGREFTGDEPFQDVDPREECGPSEPEREEYGRFEPWV